MQFGHGGAPRTSRLGSKRFQFSNPYLSLKFSAQPVLPSHTRRAAVASRRHLRLRILSKETGVKTEDGFDLADVHRSIVRVIRGGRRPRKHNWRSVWSE